MATDGEFHFLERLDDDRGAVVAPTRRGGYPAGYGAQVDEAEVIRQFVPLVKRLALRLKGRLPETVQLDDLIQAGLIAVLRLARHGAMAPAADPALQRSIVNAMIDESRREVWAPVRTISSSPRSASARRCRSGSSSASAATAVADDEIAAVMGLSLGDYHAVLVEIAGIRLLDIAEFDETSDDQLHAVDNQDAALDHSR